MNSEGPNFVFFQRTQLLDPGMMVFQLLHAQPDAHYEGWCVALSPDSRIVATAHTDGVALRDAKSGVEGILVHDGDRAAGSIRGMRIRLDPHDGLAVAGLAAPDLGESEVEALIPIQAVEHGRCLAAQ